MSKPCVFGVDDAHWIDRESWGFFLDLATDPNSILILAMRPFYEHKKYPAMNDILEHPNTHIFNLEGLNSEEMSKFACMLLEVDTLPPNMHRIICERSHGNPLWCEELVESMLEMKFLKILDIPERIEEEDETKIDDNVSLRDGTSSKVIKDTKPEKRRSSVVEINEELEVGDIPIPDSMNGMVLARIDHMSPSEQMTLKCAAIIGMTFTRSMVAAIVPNANSFSINQTLEGLAQHGIIECAIAAEVANMEADLHSRNALTRKENLHLQCSCLVFNENSARRHSLSHSSIQGCEFLQFVHVYVQETAYGLWTESQRMVLHKQAAIFLESMAHKCRSCGGGGFVAGGSKPTYQKAKDHSYYPGRSSIDRNKKVRWIRRKSRLGSKTPSVASSKDSREEIITVQANKTGETFDSYESCAANLQEIDLHNCQCDDVLAHVYPQLVRHWKAAGDEHKELVYLIEAGAAAMTTLNNMEALSLLKEAKTIVEENKDRELLSQSEKANLECIYAQVCFIVFLFFSFINFSTNSKALFQSGFVSESIPHFKMALTILGATLQDRNNFTAGISVVNQAIRQWLHIKMPNKYMECKKCVFN